ncbi:MAG: hypothetical protein QGG64_10060 [Candidatus Latescibacteria bacterium]|jgi:hypothetical protein|nr:hypothetical protein [Candidatus Latescibacterota bacterium]
MEKPDLAELRRTRVVILFKQDEVARIDRYRKANAVHTRADLFRDTVMERVDNWEAAEGEKEVAAV